MVFLAFAELNFFPNYFFQVADGIWGSASNRKPREVETASQVEVLKHTAPSSASTWSRHVDVQCANTTLELITVFLSLYHEWVRFGLRNA